LGSGAGVDNKKQNTNPPVCLHFLFAPLGVALQLRLAFPARDARPNFFELLESVDDSHREAFEWEAESTDNRGGTFDTSVLQSLSRGMACPQNRKLVARRERHALHQLLAQCFSLSTARGGADGQTKNSLAKEFADVPDCLDRFGAACMRMREPTAAHEISSAVLHR
jgi:hypothetical protein